MRLVLPEDQYHYILSYLTVDSVFAMSETCRQLFQWRRLCKVVDTGDVVLEDYDLGLLLQRFPRVTELTLGHASRLTGASYKALAAVCPQMTSLRIRGARVIDDAPFCQLLSTFNSARRLELSGTFYVKSSAIASLASSAQHLQRVCLGGFRQLKDADVQVLLDTLPLVEELSVADCTTLTTLALKSPGLRDLNISKCIHIRDMVLDMPGLTSLDASWCTKLPDSAVEGLLVSCPKLDSLMLMGCSSLVGPNMESRNLKTLDLSLCENLTHCAVHGWQLVHLSVAMCMGLSSLHLDLPAVGALDLSMLGLQQLVLNCANLENINLRGSHKLDSKNVQSHCPRLRVVDLCGTTVDADAFPRDSDPDTDEGDEDEARLSTMCRGGRAAAGERLRVIQGGTPLQWHTSG